MTNPGLELISQIHWIGQQGFDYVDLALEPPRADHMDIEREALLETLLEYNLGIIVHTSPYLPISNPHGEARKAAMREMFNAIHLAEDLGAGLLTIHYLGGPSLFTSEAILDLYVQLLEELCVRAVEAGLSIAIENSPRNQDEVLIFREIFQRVPEVRLLLDIGHTHINTKENSAPDFLRDEILGRRLSHVHVSDNDGRSDLHLPLGSIRNGVDWQEIIGLLKGHGYNGTVTLEIFSPVTEYLITSRNRLQALWEETN